MDGTALSVQNCVCALLLRRFVATRILSNAEIAATPGKRMCSIFVKRAAKKEKRPPVRRPQKRREGNSTPGPDFSRHGISSAAAVGSSTLGRCDEISCFIGFSGLSGSPNSVKTGFVKNLSKPGQQVWRPCAALLSNARDQCVGPKHNTKSAVALAISSRQSFVWPAARARPRRSASRNWQRLC